MKMDEQITDAGRETASLPDWLAREEEYSPPKDTDRYIGRNIMKLLSLLTAIRDNPAAQKKGPGAAARLLFTLLLIVLMAMSHNMVFTWLILAGFLVRILFLPGEKLSRVFRSALGAALFSMLFLLPSLFMGAPRTMLTVSVKVFVSVGLISCMGAVTPFNQITAALKAFHLPDMVIFILDITLKYIAILGELCMNILIALQLRSVGRDRRKNRSASGVLGVTLLKSREMADEMYAAMMCRGFEGEYRRREKRICTRRDLPLFLLAAALAAAFVWLERVM